MNDPCDNLGQAQPHQLVKTSVYFRLSFWGTGSYQITSHKGTMGGGGRWHRGVNGDGKK